MADLTEPEITARLAVLDVMGWRDDRDDPGTPDGVPPAACWNLAGEIVAAVREALTAPAKPLVTKLIAERYGRWS